ncbi:PepSY-associated TM helix domain-containing protein [Methylobacterium sp. WL9]|uniref:PepSY-associated TM helix domain-containing protein n=1 Tax=Methylobacterium sp. WL9 TaxID=2603898 RepID=UPI0011C8820C|nr:PepSY-associated TM helix domain-containing protein [Methylobacterium sp. WL9]TXN23218.1 PepSY domain-containing protein [Methylobacterium sp. WL9]
MRNGLRQSMAWLHSWAGLVAGWVLFCIFVTGTATYYRADVSRWMRPELPVVQQVPTPDDLARAAETAVAHLKGAAPNAIAWYVTLPSAADPAVALMWFTDFALPPGTARLDPATGGPPAVRETFGGDFFYRFHFELNLPSTIGRWIAGICAMIGLVTLLSGIITHRRIFADFFTFRRHAKSAQRSWLDAHNVAGVVAIPFHLMITYTGIATLALIYMPWGVLTAYKGDAMRFYGETGQITAPLAPAGKPGTLAPVGPMVRQALERVSEPLEMVIVEMPGDAKSKVVAVFEEPHGLSHQHPQVAFAGATGTLLQVLNPNLKPASKTFTTMVGLHEAHFAGPALRVLFFLCGLTGAAMVGTGLVLWSVARLPTPGAAPFFGLRLVRVLNLGTVAGLPAAVAAYFLANRLLPVGLGARADWEVGVFFAVWILAAVYAALRPQAAVWREMLGACAALFLAVPVVNGLATGRHPLASAAAGDALYLWFDAAMLALAGLFAIAAYKARSVEAPGRRRPQAVAPLRRNALEQA